MAIIKFPPGGQGMVGGEPRKVKASDVVALLPAAAGRPDLEEALARALRVQDGGYCYLSLDLEVSLLQHALGN